MNDGWNPTELMWTAVEEVTDFAIYLIDPEGVIQYWNKGAELIKGYSADEIRGQNFAIFYTPEARANGKPPLELREARDKGRFEDEDWRVRKDGTWFWGNEIITAIRDESGTLRGHIKISRDLSDRKRMEESLRVSEQRYRNVVEGVRDYAIFSSNPDRLITSWNKAAERIIGYTEAEILGNSSDIIFTAEDRAKGDAEDEAARARTYGRAENERWHVRKDGSRFWGSGVMTASRDEKGQINGFFKVLRDHTERKEMEDERNQLLRREQAARQEAEEATRLKDEFLAVVSHELRTPLAAILLWVKLLRAGMLNETTRAEAADVIESSAKSQQELIEDLLDVSRILSGRMRLQPRPTDLAALAEAAIEAVRPMAEAKSLEIRRAFDPDLSLARVDPDRVQQVIWNLLTNAVKFTAANGRIELEIRQFKHEIRLRVTDTGKGIGADFLPHVFDRFRQADASTTRLESGLGLGMSITRQLVEMHGGTIRADSAGEGQGATFTVQLPLHGILVGSTSRRPRTAEAVFAPSTVLKGMWILLVEDDDATRRAVTWTLEQSGAEVTAVPSTEEALHALAADMRNRRPDLLISDIAMPGQDGFELIRKVRRIEKERGQLPIPAMALTAYVREHDKARIREAGFDDLMHKPVEPVELVQRVSRLGRRTG